MSKLYFRINLPSLTESPLFHEASKEELRVLLAVIASGGESTENELSTVAKCSLSRCKSALTLFSEEGIIELSDIPFSAPDIEYEHGVISHFTDTTPDAPQKVAESIHNHNLSDLLDECSALLGKTGLSSAETAKIVSLVTNLSLDGEYITALISFMKTKGKCTVTSLVKKAEELVSKGINTYENLENYIRACELPGYVQEFRRVLGGFGRPVSDIELDCYKKWAEEFGFSTEILKLAYSKSVIANASGSISYIDKVLTSWHASGCKTAAQCEESNRAFKEAREAEKKEHAASKKKKSKTDAPTPRYGNFDVEEAFKLALSRSYGDDDSEKSN